MKNGKSLRCSFIAKFFSGFIFILSSFTALFTFLCIVFLTANGTFDSSKEAAVNSMRDNLYYRVCRNYCYDALNLCIYGDKSNSIFEDSNFRYVITDENGQYKTGFRKSTDGKYIYSTSFDFLYPTNKVFETNSTLTFSSKSLEPVEAEESETINISVEAEDMETNSVSVQYNITEGYYYNSSYSDDFVYETCTFTGYVDGNLSKNDQFLLLHNFVNIIYEMRFIFILTCILTLATSIISFVFLMATAGYRENTDIPHLNWLDKVPFELMASACFIAAIAEMVIIKSLRSLSISMVIWIVFFALLDITILLLICLSIAARVRCKSFWKSTLIYMILHGILVLLKKMFLTFLKVLSYVPTIWQVILLIGFVCFGELFLLILWGAEDCLAIMVLEKIIVIPFVLYIAIMLSKLEETTKKVASGDMSATVNTTMFIGSFRRQGENLNRIKLGISNAVEDKMKSERFKTELITNVSHDIKTPLTSIINYVDLLDKEDLQNETAKEYIQIISKHSDRLKKLVVDLVDLSKASSGVINLDMQPLKIDVLLEQIAGEYNERLAACNLELIIRKPDELMTIMADGQRIYRVFDNLMNNICKYALHGTRVYLILENINNQAVISFKNISATELAVSADDLMERFVRGDSSRNTEGSGLGLSIAESLVSLQNGTFHIQLDGDLFKIIISFPLVSNDN